MEQYKVALPANNIVIWRNMISVYFTVKRDWRTVNQTKKALKLKSCFWQVWLGGQVGHCRSACALFPTALVACLLGPIASWWKYLLTVTDIYYHLSCRINVFSHVKFCWNKHNGKGENVPPVRWYMYKMCVCVCVCRQTWWKICMNARETPCVKCEKLRVARDQHFSCTYMTFADDDDDSLYIGACWTQNCETETCSQLQRTSEWCT